MMNKIQNLLDNIKDLGLKKLLAVLVILVVLNAIPVSLILIKQQQDIRSRASGNQAAIFFATPISASAISQITLTPNQPTKVDLYLDTKGNYVNGYDIQASITADGIIPVSAVEHGIDGAKFNTDLFHTASQQGNTNLIHFAKVHSGLPGVSGVLHLGVITLLANDSRAGTLALTKATIITPTSKTPLTVDLPTLQIAASQAQKSTTKIGSVSPSSSSSCTTNYTLTPPAPEALNTTVTVDITNVSSTNLACIILFQDNIPQSLSIVSQNPPTYRGTVNSGSAGSSHNLQIKFGPQNIPPYPTGICGSIDASCNTYTYSTN